MTNLRERVLAFSIPLLVVVAYFAGAASAPKAPRTVAIPLLGDEPIRPVGLGRFGFDRLNRLVFDAQKQEAVCPPQDERTAVVLTMGQSNAANHAGQRFRSEHNAHIVNFFAGKCYVAESPLLGATRIHGEYWTAMANGLVASNAYSDVVLAPVAVAGAEIARFAQGGDLNALVAAASADLAQADYRPTHLLWVQGESDALSRLTARRYADRFASMLETLQATQSAADSANRPQLKIYVGVTTKCLSAGTFEPNNLIAQAQRALGQSGGAFRPGVDADALLEQFDRYDGCHFGGSGAQKAGAAWAEIILSDRSQP